MDQKTQILQALCPVPLHLIWHENRRTYFSVRREKKQLFLRLHRLFLQAPTPVLEAVIRMALKNDPASRATVRQMAYLHFSKQRGIPPKPLVKQGSAYNLQEVYDRLKKDHFQPDFDASIGWSDTSRASRFRSMTFGTYDRFLNQIRIHALLDDLGVPPYFLEFIVYHEMLHALCPSYLDAAGRCRVHTPEFREKERRFPRYREAKKWEKTSLQYFRARKQYGRA